MTKKSGKSAAPPDVKSARKFCRDDDYFSVGKRGNLSNFIIADNMRGFDVFSRHANRRPGETVKMRLVRVRRQRADFHSDSFNHLVFKLPDKLSIKRHRQDIGKSGRESGLQNESGFGVFGERDNFVGLKDIFGQIRVVHFKIYGETRHSRSLRSRRTIEQYVRRLKSRFHPVVSTVAGHQNRFDT